MSKKEKASHCAVYGGLNLTQNELPHAVAGSTSHFYHSVELHAAFAYSKSNMASIFA